MKNYQIHGKAVTIREVTRPMVSLLGDSYTSNVVNYNGQDYDMLCNGQGDCHILIDGKKRYLEEADADRATPPVQAKTAEERNLLSIAKDLAAQNHGYADWYQIECLEVESFEKDEIKCMLLEDVACFYHAQFTPTNKDTQNS